MKANGRTLTSPQYFHIFVNVILVGHEQHLSQGIIILDFQEESLIFLFLQKVKNPVTPCVCALLVPQRVSVFMYMEI